MGLDRGVEKERHLVTIQRWSLKNLGCSVNSRYLLEFYGQIVYLVEYKLTLCPVHSSLVLGTTRICALLSIRVVESTCQAHREIGVKRLEKHK